MQGFKELVFFVSLNWVVAWDILEANNIPHCPFHDVLDLHFLLPSIITKIVHVSVEIFGE
jgi:hypothetical protein